MQNKKPRPDNEPCALRTSTEEAPRPDKLLPGELNPDPLRRQEDDLDEFYKGLNCFHELSTFKGNGAVSFPEDLQKTVESIPKSCRYPEIAEARITLGGREFRTANYGESESSPSPWREACNIVVEGQCIGTVEVCYRELRPESEGEPFLREEMHLIDAIAGRLGRMAARLQEEAALRKSEAMHRILVEHIPMRIFMKDANSVYLFCNKPYAQDMSIDPADIVGKDDSMFYSPELAVKYQSDDKRVMLTGKMETTEEKYLTKGEYRWTNSKKVPLHNKDGMPLGIFGIFEDVTERKHSEEMLRKSEEKYRILFESSTDAVMTVDEKGFLDCNNATLSMFGSSAKEDFLKMHPGDVSPPFQTDGEDSWTAARNRIDEANRKGSSRFEWIHRKMNGEDFYADVLLTAFNLGRKQVLQATVRDISAEKQTRECLLLFKDLVRYSTDAIGMSTPDGRHYYQNEAFDLLFGDIGDNSQLSVFTDKASGESVFQTIMGGGRWEGEVKMFNKYRTILDIYLRAYAIRNADGHIIALVGQHADITSLTRARKDLHTSLREKEMLLREFHNRTKNKLQAIVGFMSPQVELIEDEKVQKLFQDTIARITSLGVTY